MFRQDRIHTCPLMAPCVALELRASHSHRSLATLRPNTRGLLPDSVPG